MRFFPTTSPTAACAAVAILTACVIVSGCSTKEDPSTNVNLTPITFPNGTHVVAETVRNEFEMMRGLMYRDSLAADRGMLFVHGKEGKYTYWMYQTKIPLDMIWLDHEHKIVEVAAGAQPCTTKASECPKYGGHRPATYVLELNSGAAAKNNLQEGDFIDF